MNERIWYGGRPGVPERQKVLAAMDLALWDIKAKWLGVPVYELLGGLFRDRIPLYWSHFATYRASGRRSSASRRRTPTPNGRPAPATSSPRASRCSRRTSSQRAAPAAAPALPRYLDGAIDRRTIDDAVAWIGTLRDVVGPGIGIAVDVQFDYRMGGIVQLARALEPFDLYWLEVESLDPDALLAAREQTTDPPLPRREPHPARAVPAVLPEARDRRGDDRDPVQRPVRVAPDRRDGRALRHDDLAAQLDEPARDADQRPPVRRRLERRDPRDRPRRRALEGRPADPPARDRGRPAGRPGPAGLGRRHRRGRRARPTRSGRSACHEDHRHRADHLRQRHRRPRLAVRQGHHRRGDRRLGRGLRLAHRVACWPRPSGSSGRS